VSEPVLRTYVAAFNRPAKTLTGVDKVMTPKSEIRACEETKAIA